MVDMIGIAFRIHLMERSAHAAFLYAINEFQITGESRSDAAQKSRNDS